MQIVAVSMCHQYRSTWTLTLVSDSRLDLSVYRHLIHLPQVIPVPKTPSDALRQAFVDHGKSQGVELSDIPRDASLSKVGMYEHRWAVCG